ncbi:MAG: hypothetical protein HOP28_18235 [Gemmatimonadales bacterium]|nr:hypothetical protein [Gemmatimonadales bacterium]
MANPAIQKPLMLGSILQGIMVAVGKFVPALGTQANFYPIVGTVISVLMGAQVGRGTPGPLASALGGGAVVGGGCSLVGSALAALTGQAAGMEMQTIGIATGTGAVSGLIGAVLGRVLPRRPA